MDEIPDDVMRAAREAAAYWSAYETFYFEKLVGDFARTILAERERAAKIIEARLPLYSDIGQLNALRECLSSIRTPDTQE